MTQSNKIFSAIVFAFVVYITLRGQLPEYISLFTSKSNNPAPVSNVPATQNNQSASNIFENYQAILNTLGL